MRTTKKLIAILLCLAMLPCSLLTVFATGEGTQTDAVEAGNVLYYQQFNGNVESISSTGMDVPATTTISSEGYLSSSYEYGKRRIVANLPDVLPSHNTYTIEMTFRFNGAYKEAASIQIGWGPEVAADCLLQITHGQGLKMTYYGKDYTALYDNYSDMKDAWWSPREKPITPGNFVDVKIQIENGKMTNRSFTVNNVTYYLNNSESLGDNYFDGTINVEQIFIRQYNACVDISDIRIVEGVGYTEYKGQFAERSYSDFYNTSVISKGVQPTVMASQEIRLVAEIKGTDFKAAGFNVSITYTDSEAADPKALITTSKDMTAHCAYLSLGARGENNEIISIKPELGGDHLIAIAINDIESRYTITNVTFTPYAIDANGYTYIGSTYNYDYATQSVSAQ